VQEVIEGAKHEMRSAGRDLLSIRYRLLGVRASILPTSEEISKGDLTGDLDVETKLRIVIDCNVQDHLDPLIEGILKGASDQRETREATGNAEALSIAHLDFSVFSEETRQRLYEVVAAENFGPTEEELAEVPVQYTAEQAGLEVVFAWGRWFATWWKLELPETLPEAERREILLLQESRNRPGMLDYGEI
jgi:hypothetical protein